MCIFCDTHMHTHRSAAILGQSWEWFSWNQCANDRDYKPDDSLSSWGKINCVKSSCSMVGSIVCTSQFNINIVLCIWHCLTLNELWLSYSTGMVDSTFIILLLPTTISTSITTTTSTVIRTTATSTKLGNFYKALSICQTLFWLFSFNTTTLMMEGLLICLFCKCINVSDRMGKKILTPTLNWTYN